MSRAIAFILLTAVSLLTSIDASAQREFETPPSPAAEPQNDESRFHFGITAGVSLGYTSIDVPSYSYSSTSEEDQVDAIGFTGTLQLMGLALERSYESGHKFSFLVGYRFTVDQFLAGFVNTGFVHRHEVSLGFSLNRRITAFVGAGVASLHDPEYGVFPGPTAHLDLRYSTRSGFVLSLPFSVSTYLGESNVVVASVGLELGWQSLR